MVSWGVSRGAGAGVVLPWLPLSSDEETQLNESAEETESSGDDCHYFAVAWHDAQMDVVNWNETTDSCTVHHSKPLMQLDNSVLIDATTTVSSAVDEQFSSSASSEYSTAIAILSYHIPSSQCQIQLVSNSQPMSIKLNDIPSSTCRISWTKPQQTPYPNGDESQSQENPNSRPQLITLTSSGACQLFDPFAQESKSIWSSKITDSSLPASPA